MTRPTLADFVEISHGAFELSVVDLPDIIFARDQRLASAIQSWMTDAECKPAGEGPLCLCCDANFEIKFPAAFVVATPFIPPKKPKKSMIVISGVCKSCLFDDDFKANMLRCWQARAVKGGLS
jgi:hypothetical protein